MREQEFFLLADRYLREVIHQLRPEHLELRAPAEWTPGRENPTLRDVVAAHAHDEAWVPDVVAGRTIDEVGDVHEGDLLGDDPIGSYEAINEATTGVMREPLDPERVVHVTYGQIPLAEYLTHISSYRAFQAALIARLAGIQHPMPDRLLDYLTEIVVPRVEEWRAIGIFGPALDVPEGADRETGMLAAMGFAVT